jgi:carbonic anhydrase
MENGLTELNIGGNQAIINDGHTIQANFHAKPVLESIRYAGNTYQLLQLHFHSPSENELNGESAPLEIHFVHQGPDGKVVVVGVLVKGGSFNPTLQSIIDHLPQPDGKEYIVDNEMINPQDLFPLDHDYYSFIGSLTTPPCLQGLEWIVMAGTITASPGQIAIIRKAIGGSNARAVQPLNHRVIAYSMGKNS